VRWVRAGVPTLPQILLSGRGSAEVFYEYVCPAQTPYAGHYSKRVGVPVVQQDRINLSLASKISKAVVVSIPMRMLSSPGL
jgi:hypothetical protein